MQREKVNAPINVTCLPQEGVQGSWSRWHTPHVLQELITVIIPFIPQVWCTANGGKVIPETGLDISSLLWMLHLVSFQTI